MPGPVVQLVTSSGQDENMSSSMFFFLVGSKFNCSRWKSAASCNKNSHCVFFAVLGMCVSVSQFMPERLKSPPRNMSGKRWRILTSTSIFFHPLF